MSERELAGADALDQMQLSYEQGRADALASIAVDVRYAARQLRSFSDLDRALDALERIEEAIGPEADLSVRRLGEILDPCDVPF